MNLWLLTTDEQSYQLGSIKTAQGWIQVENQGVLISVRKTPQLPACHK